MKNLKTIALALLVAFGTVNAQTKKVDVNIIALIKKMSIEEKAGQMTQIDLGVIAEGGICALKNPQTIDLKKIQEAISKYHIGSILNVGCGSGTISLENIPVKLVFQKMEDNSLRLAWDLSIYLLDASHYYSVRIDAVNGDLLDTIDWVVNCAVEKGMFSNHTHIKDNNRLFSQTKNMALSGGAQYRVFAMPIESPNHGVDTLEADPSGEGEGSPFGWHDTDGVPGAEHTITRGNNVWSKDDINANNGTDGISADGGAELIFDFPYIFDAPPVEMIEAATVNLFYWNNLMHDIYYQYGISSMLHL